MHHFDTIDAVDETANVAGSKDKDAALVASALGNYRFTAEQRNAIVRVIVNAGHAFGCITYKQDSVKAFDKAPGANWNQQLRTLIQTLATVIKHDTISAAFASIVPQIPLKRGNRNVFCTFGRQECPLAVQGSRHPARNQWRPAGVRRHCRRCAAAREEHQGVAALVASAAPGAINVSIAVDNIAIGDTIVPTANLLHIAAWCVEHACAKNGGRLPRTYEQSHEPFPEHFCNMPAMGLFHKAFAPAVAAGATVVGFGLYRDEAIVLGSAITVVRATLLIDDSSFDAVWPLVAMYDSNVVSDDKFYRTVVAPFLAQLSRGIRVMMLDGTGILVVGALYYLPVDMSERWNMTGLVMPVAPSSPACSAREQRFPSGRLDDLQLRCWDGTRRSHDCVLQVVSESDRVKTRANAALRAAGIRVEWNGRRMAPATFFFDTSAPMCLFSFAVGALRFGPEWLHTGAVGLKRTMMRNISSVVLHYSMQAAIDDGDARGARQAGEAAFSELNRAVKAVRHCGTLRRTDRDFFVKYSAKIKGARDTKTTFGSGRLFADMYIQMPEALRMLRRVRPELAAWCHDAAEAIESHMGWEDLLAGAAKGVDEEDRDLDQRLRRRHDDYVLLARQFANLFDSDVATGGPSPLLPSR